MSRNVIDGYQKFADEMLIWEPEDWTADEWATLCKASGVPADRTERIVLHVNQIECYINDKKEVTENVGNEN